MLAHPPLEESAVTCRLLTCCVLLFGTPILHAENWAQWRGPNNDGISNEKNLPAKFDATQNVIWKLPLPGMSGSTPAVWGDRIFLTSEDGESVALLCIGTDGKELWKRQVTSGKKRFGPGRSSGGEGNLASPSPSTDGEHVYVFTGTGDFVCFDFQGKEIWRFNAEERYGKFKIQWGMHVTPLLHGDRLYHCLLHSGGWWVMALDKHTGKEIWKVRRDSDARAECEQAYASPMLWTNGKEEYLVIHGCDYATAHSLADGSEIWRVGGLNPKDHYNGTLRFVTTPLVLPDIIIVPSAKNGPVVAVKPDAKGTVTAGSPYEQWRRPHDTPDVPSPLIHDGLLYLCGENGMLRCIDVKTGKDLYKERLHGARYRSSPVYADGKVYCIARDGVISVVKAGPEFELLAANKMPDEISSSLAISNGRIYIRGWETLYAIGEGGK
jgi:outer membrane protein assembly factor BamB